MKQLLADHFSADPRVQKGKDLILEALQEHQQQLQGVRPADPERKVSYAQLIAEMSAARGGRLYYPYLGSGIGKGPLVELLDGSVKYDLITGIGVHYLGHSHPDLVRASLDAACSDTVMEGNLQQNKDALDLSQSLVLASGLDHCMLTTSGAMANENALKLALQKHSPAGRILAFEHCFAGRSWSLSQITDKAAYRQGLPILAHVDYVPHYDPKDPQQSIRNALTALNTHLDRYPGQHAAMLFELVQGEAGFYPGSKEFFTTLMTRCRQQSIAVIADEVQSFARTEKLFAYQYFEVEQLVDIATVGKALQVCATLFRKTYVPKPGLLSQTFTGSTSSLRAAQVVLNHVLNGDFLGRDGRIARLGAHFHRGLTKLATRQPSLLQGPFGIGTMVAFTPLDGQVSTVSRYLQILFDAGVIAFTAGANPTRVRFLVPAGVLQLEDINIVLGILEATLLQMQAEIANK